MKAFVTVEGKTDLQILQSILPREILNSISIQEVGRARISYARTLMVTQRKPLAFLVNSKTRDEGLIHEKLKTSEELLKMVSGKIPVKVITFVPGIESVFFQAPGVIERHFGGSPEKLLLLLALENPKEALEQLFTRKSSSPHDLDSLLNALTDEDISVLHMTPPIRELISFLMEITSSRHQKTAG